MKVSRKLYDRIGLLVILASVELLLGAFSDGWSQFEFALGFQMPIWFWALFGIVQDAVLMLAILAGASALNQFFIERREP